jgi:copper chaperone NosL
MKIRIMKYIQNITILLLVFIFLSCGLEPEPINYGKDLCAHCNMKIMDKRYGAEFVNSKGKVFKFDSGECLIEYINQNNLSGADNGLKLVTDFNNPGNLIKTGEATFIISQKLPSPMGAFLTAFSSKNEAQKKVDELGGEVFNWSSVTVKILNKH